MLAAELVLAASIVAMVASISAALASVEVAIQQDNEAARSAAVIAARTGDNQAAAQKGAALAHSGASLELTPGTDLIRTRVRGDVTVPHPVSGRRVVGTEGSAEVPIAPYRSNRE